MKIAFTNWSNRMVGGAEQYLSEVAQYMALRGHRLGLWHQVSSPEDRPALPFAVGTPTWDVSKIGLCQALTGLREWGPDVIFCQGMLDPETEAETLKIAPAVFFAHNYHGTCISGSKCTSFPSPKPCGRQFGLSCLIHYLPRRCGGLSPFTMIGSYRLNVRRLEVLALYSRVITHSGSLTREYVRHGIACKKVRYFAGAAGQNPMGAADWVPDRSWRILMIGRMMATKGGHLLLEALPELARQLKRPISLTMAGDGPSRAAWQEQAARISERCPEVKIAFPGWITSEDRDRIFGQTDLLVVPSVWPEPFGLVGIEAAGWGIPAVGFGVGGIPDWLTDGENGALASAESLDSRSLADAITRCLGDEAIYRGLRLGAWRMARRMTIESHYDDVISIFEDLQHSHSGKASLPCHAVEV